MDLFDDGGGGQAEDVVGAFEVAWMIREPRAAVAGFVEPVALNHRSHRAVEDENAAIE